MDRERETESRKTKTRRTNRGFWLAAVAKILLLPPILLPPIFNPGHTAFILGSMSKHKADCSFDVEPNNPELYPYDIIAVPEADFGSIDNQIRHKAAEIALSMKLAPEEIFLGLNNPESINTATNMKELAGIVRERGLKKILLVTSSSHTIRATAMACANGVAASSLPAELLLITQDPQQIGVLNERYSSWDMFITHLKETIEASLLIWDPTGEVPTYLRKWQIGNKPTK